MPLLIVTWTLCSWICSTPPRPPSAISNPAACATAAPARSCRRTDRKMYLGRVMGLSLRREARAMAVPGEGRNGKVWIQKELREGSGGGDVLADLSGGHFM